MAVTTQQQTPAALVAWRNYSETAVSFVAAIVVLAFAVVGRLDRTWSARGALVRRQPRCVCGLDWSGRGEEVQA